MARPLDVWHRRMSGLAHSIERPVPAVAARFAVLQRQWVQVAQVALSATASWLFARHVVGHPQPFFAPVAAAIAVYAGSGQRRQVVLELVLGVSVGILAGELLIGEIGRGTWQLSLVVVLAMVLISLIGIGPIARMQATSSAIIVATVSPVAGSGNPAVNRFLDALVGGLIGLVVIFLVPTDPLRAANRELTGLMSALATGLDSLTTALHWRDPGPAWTGLQHLRNLQSAVNTLTTTLDTAEELSLYSPLRRRYRGDVGRYVESLRFVDNAVRDARVLARRVEVLLRRGQRPPNALETATSELARCVRIFAADFGPRARTQEVQSILVETVRQATLALPAVAPISVSSSVAQVRSLAADLLYATGVSPHDVEEIFEDVDSVDAGGPGSTA